MPTASEVAGYILSLMDDDAGDTISNLKLQKLLYYVQGFHLAAFDTPLFPDEIQAWMYGPVVPDVYHQYKAHGSLAIPRPAEFNRQALALTEETTALITDVLSVYGEYSAGRLMKFTHAEPPWQTAYRDGRGARSPITFESLRAYFKTQLDD